MQADSSTLVAVQDYYGKVLRSTDDLRTSACCSTETAPHYIREMLAEIHVEILSRFYGCGSPIPLAVEGCCVVDLGCGTGRDAYVLSKLVGQHGSVIGVDFTEEQLDVARSHIEFHRNRFGFGKPNIDFRLADIEDLKSCGISDDSVDIVVSNCVINLASDKEAVFREISRVLKPGGELYFSDVFADRRIPDGMRRDPVLYGECLGGALYAEDFRRMLDAVGLLDHRVAARAPIEISDRELATRVGNVSWTSMTVRAFKLLGLLEDRCEDYGQMATYLGTIPHAPHSFVLDDHHVFQTGKPALVCGNTAAMLTNTRYGSHFVVSGDRGEHFGLFECVEGLEIAMGGTSSMCC